MVRVRVGVVMVTSGAVIMLMAVVVNVVMIMVVVVVRMMMIVVMTMVMAVRVIVPMIIMRGTGPDAFDVVVMAFLLKADFGFEAEHLFAVLAHLAIHVAGAFKDLGHPISEGFQHQGMVVQVAGLDELDIRELRRDRVGVVVDPLDEDASEQEVGEHHDAPVAQLRRVLQGGGDQREGDP